MRSAGFLQTEEGGRPQKEREDIWSAMERLLVAAGARRLDGVGTRVHFEKDGEIETFHRPHPAERAKRYQVHAARAFVERIGRKA